MGLLLGRSSTTMKGILVAPGVVDTDYEGEVKVMTHSPKGISVIRGGQRLAQLVLVPQVQTRKAIKRGKSGEGDLGSSDAYWVQVVGTQRPELKLWINGREFIGLLDTGVDVSVITVDQWPSHWPRQPSITHFQGIGQSQSPEQSSNVLQ